MIRWFLKRSGRIRAGLAALILAGACVQSVVAGPAVQGRKTEISIVGDDFHINGAPTMRAASGKVIGSRVCCSIARMVQGIYDDLNTSTVTRWAYPDTGQWDAAANTLEFIAAMPEMASSRAAGIYDQSSGRLPSWGIRRNSRGATPHSPQTARCVQTTPGG